MHPWITGWRHSPASLPWLLDLLWQTFLSVVSPGDSYLANHTVYCVTFLVNCLRHRCLWCPQIIGKLEVQTSSKDSQKVMHGWCALCWYDNWQKSQVGGLCSVHYMCMLRQRWSANAGGEVVRKARTATPVCVSGGPWSSRKWSQRELIPRKPPWTTRSQLQLTEGLWCPTVSTCAMSVVVGFVLPPC